jgi:hypothetical protein
VDPPAEIPAIISRGEALQILKNDLRRAALERHAAELANASAVERLKITERIDHEVQRELRPHWRQAEPEWLIH